MAHDRSVAGIRCSGVLELLPEYVEDDLDEATKTRLEAHLRGCDWCERFGGRYAATVRTLRNELAGPATLDEGVRARLSARLHAEGRTTGD